ncbi:MAG: GntR family transcriptional regulator [Pseudorhodoplanes sp.]|nr:GntR family transcriptional regulator [Pseudorhodoplanes sp.]
MTDIQSNSPYPFLPVLNRDKRGGTVQHIHDVIRDAIVRLDMPPGALIDKNALCERLGVSRFPVSEALGRLAEDGFVEILPQRGTRVTRINLADCREAMFIRRSLEAYAVRVVATHDNAALLSAIRDNLAAQRAAMKKNDRIAFHELDLALHDLLLDTLGFERVKTAVYAARAKLDRMRLFLCTPQRQAFTIAEHERIFEALRARDPAAAGQAMEEHLDMVMTELASFVATRPDVFEMKVSDIAVA